MKSKYEIYKHIGKISEPNNGWIKEEIKVSGTPKNK